MKTFIIGDIHLSEVCVDYFRHILFPFLYTVNQEKEFDEVLLVGDVFHSPAINNITSALFKELLSIFDCKITILNGNHEKISKTESIYDILMLPSNVTVYKEVTYHNNHIYVPHINKSLNQHEIFADIQQYIKSNNFDDVFIYSHNDFAEVYKFRNNFFNVTNSFENITNRIFLTNGHNHVPFFKKNDNIYIFNIGCAINTSFSDSGLYNYFMIVDDQEDDIENIFDVFKNNFSVQYHTFHIHKESHIYELCNNLNKENYSFVNFIIHDPTVVIDSNFKNTLQTQFNVVDVFIEYDLKPILNKSDASVDSTSLTDLCEKLNIKTTDFMDDKSTHQSEKMVILFSLLNVMFEKRSTSSTDIDKVISVIKKHMLLD